MWAANVSTQTRIEPETVLEFASATGLAMSVHDAQHVAVWLSSLITVGVGLEATDTEHHRV